MHLAVSTRNRNIWREVKFWASKGDILSITRKYLEHHKEIYVASQGNMLSITRKYFEHHKEIFWVLQGNILSITMTCFGHQKEIFGASQGNMLSITRKYVKQQRWGDKMGGWLKLEKKAIWDFGMKSASDYGLNCVQTSLPHLTFDNIWKHQIWIFTWIWCVVANF